MFVQVGDFFCVEMFNCMCFLFVGVSEMSAHTQLSEKEMKRTLQSLVDVKLVNQTGTVRCMCG